MEGKRKKETVEITLWGRAISREARTTNENNSPPAALNGTTDCVGLWIGARERLVRVLGRKDPV
jgi:hypothetical protein